VKEVVVNSARIQYHGVVNTIDWERLDAVDNPLT
jgi:hypothetical protein